MPLNLYLPTEDEKLDKKKKAITIYKVKIGNELKLPYVEMGVKAGFPSPAQDYVDYVGIDLNKELIRHPSSTFFARVDGDSMIGAGIDDGDILIIDRELEAVNGNIVLCFIDNEFTVKTLEKKGDDIYLNPANINYKPIKVTSENDFMIWGVVTYSIKKHR